jgi:hypothetical protein
LFSSVHFGFGRKADPFRASGCKSAYKLFSAGKTTLEVAIALQLGADKANEYHKDYLKLVHRDNLNQVYEEIKGNIEPFVNLYKSAKAVGMNAQPVTRLLVIANNNLLGIELKYERLKEEVNALESQKLNSHNALQNLTQNLEYSSLLCQKEMMQMNFLCQKRMKLEDLVRQFENNNEEYIKISKTPEQKVLYFIRWKRCHVCI